MTIGSFRSEADAEEQAREREETKRLLYVAATRARDRLYLSAVLSQGELKAARGSLAEVLPESLAPVFTTAASAPASDTVVRWTGPSGNAHGFTICRPPSIRVQEGGATSPSVPVAGSTAGDRHDRFDLLKPDASGRRMTVTE